jgi:hypothetical protein
MEDALLLTIGLLSGIICGIALDQYLMRSWVAFYQESFDRHVASLNRLGQDQYHDG